MQRPYGHTMSKDRARELEAELLANVDINFLFSQGDGLNEGLIDEDRIHKIVEKIKELARSQADSKEINYQELVAYLQSSELGFTPGTAPRQRSPPPAHQEPDMTFLDE